MRFVRAYTRRDTGELIHIVEREEPFAALPDVLVPGQADAIEMHDLGLAEHFDIGDALAPSEYLFRRMERSPQSKGSGAAAFRAKAGQTLPAFLDCPTTKAAILDLLKAKGPGAISERVVHWLEYLEILSDDELEAAGLPRLDAATAEEFDAMRMKRDPSQGPRADVHKRRIAEREQRKAIEADAPRRAAERAAQEAERNAAAAKAKGPT